ncbi:uncharacterized protein VTP21DRAFT_3573 [Calcarisporiella thermophila]|uniref:uncharacterized protein n=1 Tax=Calcarisporiella thermophila TaxID=911321 RepID=UPI00374475DE
MVNRLLSFMGGLTVGRSRIPDEPQISSRCQRTRVPHTFARWFTTAGLDAMFAQETPRFARHLHRMITTENENGYVSCPSPLPNHDAALKRSESEGNRRRRRRSPESESEGCRAFKKRILPARKQGLLSSNLESTSDEEEMEEILEKDVMLIVEDESILIKCNLRKERVRQPDQKRQTETEMIASDIEVPRFRHIGDEEILGNTIVTRSKIYHKPELEDISDDAYLKRHRRYERAAKMAKNRERERLAHERYRQKLEVEKLRNMVEANQLLPMAAFRTAEGERERKRLEYQRHLLREAEDTLRRMDELGYGNREEKEQGRNVEEENRPLAGDEKENEDRGGKKDEGADRIKRKRSNSSAGRRTAAVSSPVSVSNLLSPRSIHSRSRPHLTTFKHSTPQLSGGRKSSRLVIAFGARLPQMPESDFFLPEHEFGDAMRARLLPDFVNY